jgi:hypothetical protein
VDALVLATVYSCEHVYRNMIGSRSPQTVFTGSHSQFHRTGRWECDFLFIEYQLAIDALVIRPIKQECRRSA